MQVGVERLLKHDLFENMFVMFHTNSANTTAKVQPYAPYWSAWLFKQLVGTASVRTLPVLLELAAPTLLRELGRSLFDTVCTRR